MILKKLLSPFVVLLLSVVLTAAQPSVFPEVYSLNIKLLQYSKEQLKKGDSSLQKPFDALIKRADQALTEGPFTVVSKEKLPLSGDKHDYMSMV